MQARQHAGGGVVAGESFRSTTGVYSRQSQLFINKGGTMQAEQAGGGGTDRNVWMGGGGGCTEKMCTLHAGVVFVVGCL